MKSTLAFLLFCLFFPGALLKAEVRARNGVLDLRGQDLAQPIRTTGDWDFYWNQLLTPAELSAGEHPRTTMPVPGLWSQHPDKFPAMGYATYRLRVLVDPGQQLGLFLDASVWSSSRIFVDGQEVAAHGKVGTSAETAVGGIGTSIIAFNPQHTEFDLIIQVSNFEIFLCGITIAPQFGKLEALARDRNQKVALDVIIVGALMIMGIYHLCLFLLRTEDPSTLWFGLACCFTAIWHATSRNGLAMLFDPELDFGHRLRMYNAAWISSITAFTWYLHFIFRTSFARLVCWLSSAASLAFLVTMLVTRTDFFVNLANLYHFEVVLLIPYCLYVAARATWRKEEDGGLMLLGFSILVFTAIHDILAIREIISSPMMTAAGIVAFIFFQSFVLARRFANAFVQVKKSEKEIRHLSEDLKTLNNNLEKLVEEKTRDIRSIMEHIPLGILMINQERKVHKDHSKKIYDLLDRTQLETAHAAELVFAGSNLNSDQMSQAISCIDASLGDDAMNFTMNHHLLPAELFRREEGDRQRVLELTWDPIITEDNRIDKILVTMRDVTDLRHLQERSREQQKELEYIAEIMNIPNEQFEHFVQTSDELLEQSRSLLEGVRRKGPSGKIAKLLFINMHTLKGSARSLYLKQLSQLFHEIEQFYAQILNGGAWNLAIQEQQVDGAQKLLDYYKYIAHRRLGRNPEKGQIVEIHIAELESLYQGIKAWPGPASPLLERIRMLFHGKIFKDARLVFDDLFSTIPLLARDLGKENPQIRLETRGICLSQRAEVIFRKIFIHLIRNAMDHGLEPATDRQRIGKNPVGTIYVHMQRIGDRLELRCYDDGRGLNLRRLQEVARQADLLPAGVKASPQTIASLIFHPGMSTARELSDISGRGIGMPAVQAYLEQNQGTVSVELDTHARTPPDHTPFRLVIGLPFILFEESDPGAWAMGKPA